MYQFIGGINDTKVAGSESLLNYMNENLVSKDEPSVNEHHYHIIKKPYIEEAHNIHNIEKHKSYKTNNHNFNGTQF